MNFTNQSRDGFAAWGPFQVCKCYVHKVLRHLKTIILKEFNEKNVFSWVFRNRIRQNSLLLLQQCCQPAIECFPVVVSTTICLLASYVPFQKQR